MASAWPASPTSPSSPTANAPVPISQHLNCSICLETLQDPVTVNCGHSFCEKCLICHLNSNYQICPLCKSQVTAQPKVNVILKDLVQALKETRREARESDPREFTGAQGEVVCDFCIDGRKFKAVKSCLVCSASYCEGHVRLHHSSGRFRGHKLVPPTMELDKRVCWTHGRALELYCREQQMCVCVLCVPEGKMAVPVEHERNRKQAEMVDMGKMLEEKIRKRETELKDVTSSVEFCQAQIEKDKKEIEKVFVDTATAVEDAKTEALRPLDDRRKRLESEAQELIHGMMTEVNKLKKAITNIECVAQIDDDIRFLQEYPSEVETDAARELHVVLDTQLSFGTVRKSCIKMKSDMEAVLGRLSTLETELIQKFAVDVTLDPHTAHPQLALSEDGREVKDGGVKLDVPDGPSRFDLFAVVLGQNRLSKGRAYWKVKVGENTGWDLGVAADDSNRKGQFSVTPSGGYWVVILYRNSYYFALEDTPVQLSIQEKPQVVGVFVDYEERLVSFYDMEARSHIYSFTNCSFHTKTLRPYFSPHLHQHQTNVIPLVIFPRNPDD